MSRYIKHSNYLKQLSQRQHKAKDIIRLNKEIVYPEDIDFKHIRMIIAARTFDQHGGSHHYLELLHRQERPDSFEISFDGVPLFHNKHNNIVVNETRHPLVMGQSEAFRFLSKHFFRVAGRTI